MKDQLRFKSMHKNENLVKGMCGPPPHHQEYIETAGGGVDKAGVSRFIPVKYSSPFKSEFNKSR